MAYDPWDNPDYDGPRPDVVQVMLDDQGKLRLLDPNILPNARPAGLMLEQFAPDPADLVGQQVTIAVDPAIKYHTAGLEEPNMAAKDRKDIIRARMEQLEAELVELEAFGEDDFDENTVLVFDMKFPNHEVVFTYVALKKENAWFVTGRSNSNYWSWSQLVNFWKDKVVSIHKASAFEELFLRETSKNTGAIEGEVLPPSTHNPETGSKYDEEKPKRGYEG